MTQCPVTLAFQDYTDQQDNTAQARINDGIQLEETLAWFLPGKHGDHDMKFGAQYQYSSACNTNQGNLNGTFSFGRNNAPFNAGDSVDLSGSLHDPRRRAEHVLPRRRTTSRRFAQDKWRLERPHHAEPRRCATTSRSFRSRRPTTRSSTTYPTDTNNLAPRLGVTYDARRQERRPRRLRPVLRQDALRGDRRSLHRHAVHELVHVDVPDRAADLGPRNGQLPTDPFLVNGPVINHALLDQLYPPAASCCATPARPGTTPIGARRTPTRSRSATSASSARDLAVSADYVHSQGRDLLMALNLNPQVRSNPNVNASTLTRVPSPTLTAAYGRAAARQYPGFAPFTANVTQFVNVGELDYDALMLQSEEALQPQLQRAGLVHATSSSRGNTSGNGAPGSNFQVLRRPAPGAQRRADATSTSGTTSRSAAPRSCRRRAGST